MRQFIRKNIWAAAPVLFVLIAILLMGNPLQAGDVQESQTDKDDNLIVVGVSQVGSESVWRTAHTQSVQDAFTRASYSLRYASCASSADAFLFMKSLVDCMNLAHSRCKPRRFRG